MHAAAAELVVDVVVVSVVEDGLAVVETVVDVVLVVVG